MKEKSKIIDKIQKLNLAISKLISKRRLAIGLSRSKLARSLGTTERQVFKYENGQKEISAGTLWFLAKSLQTDCISFFEEADAENELFDNDNDSPITSELLSNLKKIKNNSDINLLLLITREMVNEDM